MQHSSKRLKRTAIGLIVLMLLTLVMMTAISTQQASALNPSQWDTVRGYIASYYGGSQYNAASDGEAGFRMGKVDLWNRLDSNGDIAPNAGAGLGGNGVAVTGVASEGDDMANRPVLIDNLRTQTNVIPGTEFRCNWNTSEDCFSNASITAIRQIVDNHKAAGFSTDIVDYCVSSQTAGPTTGGFGIIAQVPGALSSDTSLIPRVYNVDYSRNGWRNSLSVANGTSAVAAPEASAGGFAAPATVANCDASATDYDLVRCQANWAISSTGGNVGNGTTNLTLVSGAGQTVDIRNGTINTVDTTGTNLQVPINTLFSTTGLANLDPLASTVMITRTQMGATASIGLEMLGYNNVLNGANINAGISRWNGAEGEDQVAQGDGLPTQSIAGFTAPGPVDTTGPSVTSVGHTNVGINSADIERVAGEPATMKVEYGTASGVYTNTANDTVLNADKTVAAGKATTLTGLSPETTYYYQVTSYDGYANGTVSVEGNFTTGTDCVVGKPNLSLAAPVAFWGSYADYTAKTLSVTWTVNNIGTTAAKSVTITSSNSTYAPITTVPGWAAIGDIAAGGSGSTVIQYVLPSVGNGFRVVNTASANDCAGNGYTYP